MGRLVYNEVKLFFSRKNIALIFIDLILVVGLFYLYYMEEYKNTQNYIEISYRRK